MNYLKDLEKLVRINSHTKNKKGVDRVGALMAIWLEELGFEKKIFEREKIGDHLLFKSKRKKGKKILLLGHNDTVFPKGYFEGYKEDDSWVYGPGVCDMKGGNIVALQALRNLFKMNSNIYNIDFYLVSDEETGSDDSIYISSAIAKDYDYCFAFEAAGKNLELVTARKGVGRCIITVMGKASHAGNSYKTGVNANLEAAIKLQKFQDLIDFEKGTVINVGKISGGLGINTVSPSCEMMLEYRYETKDERDRVSQAIMSITKESYVKGSKSFVDNVIQRDVMQENREQFELLELFESLLGYPILKEKRGGVGDANIISNCKVTTIDGFGPFGDGDHTINERALKRSFEQRIEMVTKILNYFQ